MMIELKKVTVKNFKKVKNASLSLEALNILVGQNGSGKSSIIQSLHFAVGPIRQATEIRSDKTSTLSAEKLDYLPSNQYKALCHGAFWGNKAGTPCSENSLEFRVTPDPPPGGRRRARKMTAECTLRSARNAGISIQGNVPPPLRFVLRDKDNFFSAYIPGISGVANAEQKLSRRVVLRACSFGDANVVLRNVLLLLSEQEGEIGRLQDWLEDLVGQAFEISVSHDEDSDLLISCFVSVAGGRAQPLELLGAGFIQLIQILAYILLFSPKLLLIDEPDIHLHPNLQERLPRFLEAIAEERNFNIILTTHSPFIVRGCSGTAKIYWVNEGRVSKEHREATELALGWGAFGKTMLLVSEDKNLDLHKKLLSQWPNLDAAVGVIPGSGFKNLIKPEQAKELSDALGGKYKIIVHRDRDSLTDSEVQEIIDAYANYGIFAWIPDESDVEGFFCEPEIVCQLSGETKEVEEARLESILSRFETDFRAQFNSQRTAHNREFYPDGGSPRSDEIWSEFQSCRLKGASGKSVFKRIKNEIQNELSIDKIVEQEFETPIAESLKDLLESIS